MHQAIDLVVRSRRVVTPQGVRDAAVIVTDGVITDVVGPQDIPAGIPCDDVGDLVLSPGLVDSHVHINEPGRTEWEGFETATKAAAAGGITTLVEMPLNSTPVTTTPGALQMKIAAAQGKCWVDYGFYAGVIPGNTDELEPLFEAGVFGAKAFLIHSGIDDFPNVTEGDLREAMPVIARSGLPLLVHAELARAEAPPWVLPASSYKAFLDSRPRIWENDAITLMIRLCEEFSCRVHIVHLSSSDAVGEIIAARGHGLPLTVETCPHYLYFSAEEIRDSDTRFKCAPPIRERENREKLWNALENQVIDFVVSDHSPSTPALKCLDSGDFRKAWGGISSLQFGLPAVWTEARRRGFSIPHVIQWMSTGPAQFLGLKGRKGEIAKGYDADIVAWDPEEEFTIDPPMIFHRHKVTPYEGINLSGKVKSTYVRGQRVYDRGTFFGPLGTLMRKKNIVVPHRVNA